MTWSGTRPPRAPPGPLRATVKNSRVLVRNLLYTGGVCTRSDPAGGTPRGVVPSRMESTPR